MHWSKSEKRNMVREKIKAKRKLQVMPKWTYKRKENMRVKMKGNKNPLGVKRSNAFKEEKRKRMIGNQLWKLTTGANGHYFNTSIELKVEEELQFREIKYYKQSWICGISVDFYLPEYRTIIECDGDYWHNRPGVQENDRRKDLIWEFQGFKVYRFWEHEINASARDCVNRILLPKE